MEKNVPVRIALGAAALVMLLSLWAGYAIGYHSGLRVGRQPPQTKFVLGMTLVQQNTIAEMPSK